MEKTKSLSLSPSSLIKWEETLKKWILCIEKKVSFLVDFRLFKGLYGMLGAVHPSFLNMHTLTHIKHLLLVQFFMQKEIELNRKKDKRPQLSLRVFLLGDLLSIAIAFSIDKKHLTDEVIVQMANQKIISLRKVPFSSYQWISCDLRTSFFYIELEKMRGVKLIPKDVISLRAHLEKQIENFFSKPFVFWPYNYDEGFKKLISLKKELSSPSDRPQANLSFQKQTDYHLEFLVYLVRNKSMISSNQVIEPSCFPAWVQVIPRVKQEESLKRPILTEVFSLVVPTERFRRGCIIHVLRARECIGELLEGVIGPFRDYNGGLFETTKEKFSQLFEEFADEIPQFSLFGEALFYAICPIEAQFHPDLSFFEMLFRGFSQFLSQKVVISNLFNRYVCFLKLESQERLNSCLELVERHLQKSTLTAYAQLTLLSSQYLCLVDMTGKHLSHIREELSYFDRVPTSLHLTFQEFTLPSLHPCYLTQETRGHTIGAFLFEGLIRINAQHEIEYAGCQEVVLTNKNRRYLFTLRPHFWSNGERVKASHYVEGWKYYLGKNSLTGLSLLKNGDAIQSGTLPIDQLGVTALSDDLLQVDLEREDPFFLHKLSYPVFAPVFDPPAEPEVFNGPYLVEKQTSSLLVLEKNRSYWDHKTVFFDRVEIESERSSKKIVQWFRQGKTDWIGPPFNCHFLEMPPSLLQEVQFIRPYLLWFNTKVFPLSCSLIRQALSAVIDRQFIADHILRGVHPLYTPLTHPFSSAVIEEGDEKGQKLFEAGLRALGMTRAQLPPFKLSCFHRSKNEAITKHLKKKWEEVFGIQVELDVQEWNTFYQHLEQRTFQIGGFFKHFSPRDAPLFFKSFLSEKENQSSWSHPEYTCCFNRLDQESVQKSKKARALCLEQLERLLIKHMPFTPLFVQKCFYGLRKGVRSHTMTEDWRVDFRFASIGPSAP